MDDIRPPRNYGATPPTNYGRMPGSQPSQQAPQQLNELPDPGVNNHHDQHYELPEHKKSGKGVKVLLFLFIILTLVASAFAAWQYMQITDLQTQVEDLKKENDRLDQRVYQLNYDNRDLNTKLDLATSEIEALQEENAQLQEACGTACDNITP